MRSGYCADRVAVECFSVPVPVRLRLKVPVLVSRSEATGRQTIRSGKWTVKRVPLAGSLSTVTVPPIASVSSLTIARPRPVPTARLLRVAAVEEEALERVWELLGGDPGAGVGDDELAGVGSHGDRPAGGRGAERVLDQVREHLEGAVGVGDRGGASVRLADERDADSGRLWAVTADGLRDEAGEIDRAGMDGEGPLVQAGEVEQVADEPLEPPRLGDDDGGSLLDGHDAVEDRLAVAADRGERRLQLVADREQEACARRRGRGRGPRRAC